MYYLVTYCCGTDIVEDREISAKVRIKFRQFLEKKILGFPCCSTREDLSIDVSITNVGLILTKLR